MKDVRTHICDDRGGEVQLRVNLRNVLVSEIDVRDIESGGDCAMRTGHTQTALALYALALRLRSETGFHPLRRGDDEPVT